MSVHPTGSKLRRNQSATCAPSFSWMNNSQGDDPCKIASVLLGQCTTTGVNELQATLTYTPPSSRQANLCQCNTVTYSLLCACSTCRGGVFGSFSDWTVNCPSKIITLQSFPSHTDLSIDVPNWAYFNLTTFGLFDIAAAKQSSPSASSISSRAIPTNSTFSTTTSAAASITPTTSTFATVPSKSQPGHSIQVAIITIVSLTFVASLVGCFIFYKFRYQRSRPAYRRLFTHPNRGFSISSVDSDTVVDAVPPAAPARRSWITAIRHLRLTLGVTPRVAPYPSEQIPHSSHGSPLAKVQMTVDPTTPPTQTSGSYRPRPAWGRVGTSPLPSVRSESRPEVLRANTWTATAEASTSAQSALELHNAPRGVEQVTRPPGFRIEDTPTTADGFPWGREAVGSLRVPHYQFNPEMGGSVSSFNSVPGRQWEGDDSDSVMLISRSGDNFYIHSTAGGTGSDVGDSLASPLSPGDSSRSISGSSRAPLSPATASSHALSSAMLSTMRSTRPDLTRYGTAEARTMLFPAAVRAAGYTGVPRDDSS